MILTASQPPSVRFLVGEHFCLKRCHVYLPCEPLIGSATTPANCFQCQQLYFIMFFPPSQFQTLPPLAVTTCSPTPVSIYKPYAVVTAENHCGHDVISHKYFIHPKFCAFQSNFKEVDFAENLVKINLYCNCHYSAKNGEPYFLIKQPVSILGWQYLIFFSVKTTKSYHKIFNCSNTSEMRLQNSGEPMFYIACPI